MTQTENPTDAQLIAAIDAGLAAGTLVRFEDAFAAELAEQADLVEVVDAPAELPERRVEVIDRGRGIEVHIVDDMGRRIALMGPSGRGAVTAELRRHAFAERVEYLRAFLAELPAVQRGYAVVGLDEFVAAGPES